MQMKCCINIIILRKNIIEKCKGCDEEINGYVNEIIRYVDKFAYVRKYEGNQTLYIIFEKKCNDLIVY